MANVVDRLKNANGWQRIWLSSVAAWLPAAAFIAYHHMPTIDELRSQCYYCVGSHDSYKFVDKRDECDRMRDNWNSPEHLKCLKELEPLRESSDIAETRFDDQLDADYFQVEWSTAFHAVLLWLAPAVAAYLLGWTISWIAVGFKRQQ